MDSVILEEMVRLGFWPEAGTLPEDPADHIRQRGELQKRLNELRARSSQLKNVEALKAEARKKRMAESKAKRLANKERRLAERVARADAWAVAKTTDIIYLGAGYSAGLGNRESDRTRLERHSLPIFATPAELAQGLGISVGELRFLAFTRVASECTHYRRFQIPKKSGGMRLISAPMPRLKSAQLWIYNNILKPLPMHENAHGFLSDRSIVSNATPHVGKAVVVNVDLKNFFPTVGYRRVKGTFASLGYSEAVATILALLCTEADVDEVELDDRTFYVAKSERRLPQGAPTSPALTNRICRRLDHRLTVIAKRLGFTYTRYADDLSFSCDNTGSVVIGSLLRQLAHVVGEEGFEIHPGKTRVFRRGRRQEVTGLVVNDKLAVPRKTLRRFRALLFQLEKDGPKGKKWGALGTDVVSSAIGFATFVAMVDAAKGAPLVARARAIAAVHKPAAPFIKPKAKPQAEAPDETEVPPDPKKWWKTF